MIEIARALCLLLFLSCAASAQGDAASLLSRAVALAREGQPGQARTLLDNGRRQFPADKRFLLELAGLAYRQKNFSSAASYLRAALRLDPSDAYANDFLASIDLLQGDLEAALVHWNRLDQPVLGEVRVLPQTGLNPLLRERAIEISAGQILTLDRLRTTEANLDRLGVFSSYRFELAPSGSDRFSLMLRLTDTADLWQGWPARLLSLVGALPYRTLTLDRMNIGDSATNLFTLWRWDPEKYRAAISLTGPWRQNPRYRYKLLLDARDERWNVSHTYRNSGPPLTDVRLWRVEAGVDLSVGLNGRLEWTPGFRVTRAFYARGDRNPLFADYWSIRARNQLDYEVWSLPDRHIRVDSAAWIETGSILRQSTSRFLTAMGDLHAAWGPSPQWGNSTVLTRWRGGRTFGDVPLDQLFMLGMERDNDLWLRGHIATLDGRKGNAPMGREYVLWQTDLERPWLHFPLVDVSAGPFFDAGWAGDPSGNLGSQGWMHDTGLQMTVAAANQVRWTLVYGRDLRDGRGVFYTAVERVTPRRQSQHQSQRSRQ